MKIRKAYKILVGLVLLMIYFAAISAFVGHKYENLYTKQLKIEIDNKYGFVTKNVIKNILSANGIVLDSTAKICEINLTEIEKIVNKNEYVYQTQAYSDFSGTVYLQIKQRDPIIRVMTADSTSFYLDKDMKVMPLCDYFTAEVPLLSGNVVSHCFYAGDSVNNYSVNKGKNSPKIDELCKLVSYLQSDELWRNQIAQIYINHNNEIELVPRVGNHIIILGSVEGYENKMNKLEAMYYKGFSVTNWNAYSTINLKYKDQVICKK